MMTQRRMPLARKVVEVYDKIPGMVDMVREKVSVLEQTHRDDAFFIVDLPEVYRRVEEWNRLMPRIEPFYALKCNPDAGITRFLADLGVGFDCASEREIQQILNMGVDPSRIVYANPCKPSTHLRYATENGVDLMTFDDILQLEDIKELHPNAKDKVFGKCVIDAEPISLFEPSQDDLTSEDGDYLKSKTTRKE